MKGQEVNEYMHRFLDGDLSESEKKQLMEHLNESPASAAMFERLKRLNEDLEQLPRVTPPISIVDAILPRLQQGSHAEEPDRPATPLRRYRLRQVYAWVGGAAAAVIALTVFINTWMPDGIGNHTADDSSANQVTLYSTDALSSKESAKMEIQSMSSDMGAMSAEAAGAADASTDNEEVRVQFTSGDRSNSITPRAVEDQYGVSQEAPPLLSGAEGEESEGFVGEEPVYALGFIPDDGEKAFGITPELEGVNHLSPDQSMHAAAVYSEAGVQVVILEMDGKEAYASAVYPGEITVMQWSDDSKVLTFEVASGSETKRIIIDLNRRTEATGDPHLKRSQIH